MFLNVHSSYSLKYGTMDIPAIVSKARALGIHQMVLTDINNSTGAIEFIRECYKQGIAKEPDEVQAGNIPYHLKPIAGIEFRKEGQLLYIGIAKSKEGMRELNEFLSIHNIEDQALLNDAPVFKNAFIIYPFTRNFNRVLKANEFVGIKSSQLNGLYKHDLLQQKEKLVVWHPVTVGSKVEHRLHEYLRAIELNTLLSMVPDDSKCDPDEILIAEEALQSKFEAFPFIIDNTQKLMDACDLSIYFEPQIKSKNRYAYTKEGEMFDRTLLRRIAYKGLAYRYGNDHPVARERMEKELSIIEFKNYCAYFLITFDIVRYAMGRCKFYHVGRGSGANSIVAYCLRITDVDPIDLDLYFERFLHEKRTSPPDFDIDFAWDERETIQKYIFKKYPKWHVAFLGTMSTFKDRAIIREIGKVLGLPKEEIDTFTDPTKERENQQNSTYQKLLAVHHHMRSMPNQRSIHAGGILISDEPITYYTALDMPPKGFVTVQWDMYEAEAIGYEKFDVLSQRGIGHIREAVQLIKKNQNKEIDIHDFKTFKDDLRLNAILREGQPVGCFYIESPAMRQLLKKLKCEDYLTLVAASSIIRPGVASSGMMKSFIERYHAPDKVVYLCKEMEEQLKETYGVMVYQEDVIKVCHYFAGLDLADADVLRKAMSGKYRSKLAFEELVNKFFQSARVQGHAEELITEVWRQISSFAGYSFSKAHSASFAVESYQSLYLKTYYPKEFMVAVLNNYGGFYSRWVYVHELQKTGAKVYLPCVNHSDEVVNIKGNEVYLGFEKVLGLENKMIKQIPQERRKNGSFKDLEQFVKRTQITLEQAILLIRLGALRFTGKDKKTLLWEIYNYLGHNQKRMDSAELFQLQSKEYTLPVLENSALEDAYVELELLGYPLNFNMFDFLKTSYRGEVMAADLSEHVGEIVRMVGNYVCEKTVHTIKNTKMWFGTFLDVKGDFFDTTHFPNTTPMYPFAGKGCYLILGRIVEDFGFPSVEVLKFAKLDIVMNPVATD
ncbi:DNA polymerase-3 subunit alpha [Pedobacter psychrotolerans]|uniref:DNA-directed DNA polymerase n=1 Tax=Pedobacter psychrotolerans TaxID=1843235 RepID=A0A4R2H628_9SPHI|nr:DNA polymerase III subunit alpha [Pedobacter psychrotolerans]TCO21509.1 DNA polymerase-3 subunit alpha [Pedobacter psychrotolerans]GGE39163.1 DNA-directed DNA polymerase [Pedobacter psychrotolerans]